MKKGKKNSGKPVNSHENDQGFQQVTTWFEDAQQVFFALIFDKRKLLSDEEEGNRGGNQGLNDLNKR